VSDRVARIRERIAGALAPSAFEVIDESAQHVGHAGARDGRGHYRVRIVSDAFRGVAPLARHRLVYAALGDMMQTDIHALAIEARAPDDT
jgi:BolA family transcriptional regulator, general stress-responsive regulator